MRIIIGADFYPVRRAEEKMREGAFEYLLGEIRPIVKEADYSLVNYESTFYDDSETTIKFGPSMGTDEKSVELTKWCGFKCVTLANNHIHDYGDRGLKKLLLHMESEGIDTVGAGMNVEEAGATLYKDICGETVAFINCCEHEFNIANKEHGGANPYNVVRQYQAIQEAKSCSQHVIVIVHGGSINCQVPSPRMQEQFRFFVDCGASAVICHHQHCFSGYEYYKDAPIIYGLGNLFFDKPWLKDTTWTKGYMVELTKEKDSHWEIKLLPYSQCAEEPRVSMLAGVEYKTFIKKIKELNEIIASPSLLEEKYNEWVDENEWQCEYALSPFHNRWIRALQRRHLFPSIKADSLFTLNYIYCEAHIDRMQRYLKKKYRVQ